MLWRLPLEDGDLRRSFARKVEIATTIEDKIVGEESGVDVFMEL
jgi:hypothetical protein